MRSAILAMLAFGSIYAGGSSSAAAFEYRYCLQSRIDGTLCNFTSYDQCMLAASGRGAECIVNPVIAFSEQVQPPQRPRRAHRTSDY
jgi:hypothetical protein